MPSSFTAALGRARFGRSPEQGDPPARGPGCRVPAGRRIGDAAASCPSTVTHLSAASHSLFSFHLLGFAFLSTQGKCSCFFGVFFSLFLIILKMVVLSRAASPIFSPQQVLGRPGCSAATSEPGSRCPAPALPNPRCLELGWPGDSGSFENQTRASDSGGTCLTLQAFKITNEHRNH